MRRDHHHPTQPGRRAAEKGFYIIEVLIGALLISLALLGSAALIMKAMKTNQAGSLRSLAVLLAADIAERMEANKSAALIGSYVISSGFTPDTSLDCRSRYCSTAELATYDLSRWKEQVTAALPSAAVTTAQTVTGNPSTYQITITWTDRASSSRATTAQTENFSYSTTRTVTQ